MALDVRFREPRAEIDVVELDRRPGTALGHGQESGAECQPTIAHVREDEHARDLGNFGDALIDFHVRVHATGERDSPPPRPNDVVAHHLGQDVLAMLLDAGRDVLPRDALELVLKLAQAVPEELALVHVDSACRFPGQEALEHGKRLARIPEGREPGGLPGVMTPGKAADLRGVVVVDAKRVEERIPGQELEPSVATHDDSAALTVTEPIVGNNQALRLAAREIRGRHVAVVL